MIIQLYKINFRTIQKTKNFNQFYSSIIRVLCLSKTYIIFLKIHNKTKFKIKVRFQLTKLKIPLLKLEVLLVPRLIILNPNRFKVRASQVIQEVEAQTDLERILNKCINKYPYLAPQKHFRHPPQHKMNKLLLMKIKFKTSERA